MHSVTIIILSSKSEWQNYNACLRTTELFYFNPLPCLPAMFFNLIFDPLEVLGRGASLNYSNSFNLRPKNANVDVETHISFPITVISPADKMD